jgi:opacity protein-like surface antigen
MRRAVLATASAALLLAALAAPVAAASSESFGWDESFDVAHACDVVEHVSLVATGRAYFDGEGAWLRDIIRFSYQVTYENIETGEVLVTRTRQILEATPETGTLRGQGYFIRGGTVGGVVFPDVGRLVFDGSTGSTLFASAKVLPMEDETAAERIDAALCEALG